VGNFPRLLLPGLVWWLVIANLLLNFLAIFHLLFPLATLHNLEISG
jgi:hypothetical protein